MLQYYMIKGIGGVLAEEVEEDADCWKVSYPAIVDQMQLPSGKGTAFKIDSLVPVFVKEPSGTAKNISFKKRDVIFKQSVDAQMSNLYETWKKETMQRFTGLTIPTFSKPKLVH